ncbi:MAG TPA: cation:proton antiporter [Galbitalea sp.]
MTDTNAFTLTVLVVAAAIVVAVLSNRISAWIRVPAPALFLITATVAAKFIPGLGATSIAIEERIVSIALLFILFDGGMHIGWRRFRASAAAITWIGIAGTALTAAALAVAAHYVFHFDWLSALLIGAALSPTDPAVVFSVLGKRQVSGRTGTILEGESGVNDPVGIALMVSLLAASGSGAAAVWNGIGEFAIQLGIGAVVGVVGGYGLSKLMRHVALPNEALYSVRTVASAAVIYATAALLGGSGFLAVLLAGILVGDARAPYKREVERFSAGIASVAEIVAFSVLGLSVQLDDVFQPDVIWTGVGIAALLILVIRPVFVGLVIAPIRLRLGERAFILWAGLKGAVPILLGMFVLEAKVPGASRIYAIIFFVVVISVILQGGLVPLFAKLFRIPTRLIEPEPWGLGLRFNQEPRGLHRYTVESGSLAAGATVADLNLGEEGWISMINRSGVLVQVRGSTVFQAGDVVLALGDNDALIRNLFVATRR